jgi:hypothetical protein
MYSEQLERLIQLCLADGVITEKEREVICKKAKSLGVDEDEVMVYVDGLLAEMQPKKKSSKEGEKHTCPNCGANIPAMVGKCPECDFEIRDNRASNAVTKFAEQYQSADVEKQISLVQSFPIPNNKEDLYEFTSMAMPVAKSLHKMPLWQIIAFYIGAVATIALLLSCIEPAIGLFVGLIAFILLMIMINKLTGEEPDYDEDDPDDIKKLKSLNNLNDKLNQKLGKAWEAKLNQSLIKSKFFASNDPQFATKIARVTKAYVNKKRLINILLAIVWVAVIVSGLIFMNTLSDNNDSSDSENTEYSINEDTEYSVDESSESSDNESSSADETMRKAQERAEAAMRKAQDRVDSIMSSHL